MPLWNFWIDKWVNLRGTAVRSTSELRAVAFIDDVLGLLRMVFSQALKGIFCGWHIKGIFLVDEV